MRRFDKRKEGKERFRRADREETQGNLGFPRPASRQRQTRWIAERFDGGDWE